MIKLQKMLGVIDRCSIKYKNSAFSDLGLSGCNYVYVFVLNRLGECSLDELAKEVHLNKSNVTREVQSLEESGFVIVKTDNVDKRYKKVCLTTKAKEVIPLIIQRIKKWNEVLLEGFTIEEKEVLNDMLVRIMANAIRNDEYEDI